MTRSLRLLLLLLVPVAAGALPAQEQERAFGHIVNLAGKPLAGVHVALTPARQPITEKVMTTAVATSDARGRFSLSKKAVARHRGGHLVFWGRGLATMKTTRRNIPGDVHDLGMFTMSRGVTLTGLVKDQDGKPVAGAWVAATDMMIRPQGFLSGTGHQLLEHEVIAFTDDKGRYRLPGVLPHGVDLCLCKTGYFNAERHGVGVGDPLNFTLEATKPVTGQVVDRNRKPVPGTWVWLRYDVDRMLDSYYRGGLRTDAKGRFRLFREHRGPFRVHANGPRTRVQTRSAVFAENEGEVELQLDAAYEPQTGAGKKRRPPKVDMDGLRVRAVGADGKKLLNLQAMVRDSMTMETVRRQVPWYLRSTVAGMYRATDGVVTVPRDRIRGVSQVLMVWAPGHAVFAEDLDPNKIDTGVRVRLAPESVLSGTVVDAVSGSPIAGASVVAGPPPTGKEQKSEGWQHTLRKRLAEMHDGKFSHGGVKTDAAGRFRLDRLSAGPTDVLVYLPGRPVPAATRVQLATKEHKKGLKLTLRSGAWLQLQVADAKLADPRWRLRLGAKDSGDSWTWNSYQDLANQRPVPADGKVTFAGLSEGKYQLQLIIPNPPRLGHPVTMDLGEITIRNGGNRQKVELSRQGPLPLRGKVELTGAAIPWHRVLVVAEPPGRNTRPETNFLRLHGSRAFLQPDGSFTMHVPRGRCRLLIVDGPSGVVFGMSKDLVQGPDQTRKIVQIACPIRKVRVSLAGGDPNVELDRLEVRLGSAWPGKVGSVAESYDGLWDTRVGVPLAPGQRQLDLWLPATPVEIWVRCKNQQLVKRGSRNRNKQILGRHQDDGDGPLPSKITIRLDS